MAGGPARAGLPGDTCPRIVEGVERSTMKDNNESLERPVEEADAVLNVIDGDPPGPTFAGILASGEMRAATYRNMCDQDVPNQRAAAREFSLAITALQDAGIRFARGYAELTGRSVQDLEAVDRMAGFDDVVDGDVD